MEDFLLVVDKDNIMSSWYEIASKKLPDKGSPIRGFTNLGDFFDSTVKSSRMGPKDIPVIVTEDGDSTDMSLIRNVKPYFPNKIKKQRCTLRYSYCGRIWDGEADVAEGDSIVEVSHTDPMGGLPFMIRIPIANIMSLNPK
jgi:hypothetical protein